MNIFYKEITVVALGGAFGSVMRFLLSRTVQLALPYAELPWGTITCNILGAFIIGILFGVFELKLLLNPLWRATLIIGVLGGFTTFSSFSLDTVALLQKSAYHAAFMNVFISIVVCLLATSVGMLSVMIFFKS